MHHRRPAAALFLGHRRARARLVAAHVFPELLEVVRGGRIGEPRPDIGRQRVVGGVHVGELGAAERLAVAARDADAVQHVHEAHHVAIRHVGVPVLAGVGQADILAALLQVRQRADMRFVLGIGRGARSLDLAEAFGECAQVADVELLIREAQHAVTAERQQDLGELPLVDPRHVDAMDGRAEDRAGRFNGQHELSPSWDLGRQCSSAPIAWPIGCRRTVRVAPVIARSATTRQSPSQCVTAS